MNRKITLIALAIFVASGILFAQDEQRQVEAQKPTPELERKPFQLTFMFPPLSTNWVQNSKTINSVSLNLFVGNAGGVDGVELGGFINTINYHVKGFQGAGFGNVAGRSVDGAQLAGFFNINGTDTRYLQGSGFLNISGGSFEGAQLTGFMNVVGRDARGFQGAGFGNISGEQIHGAQAAGFFNVAGKYSRGAQLAGFLNLAARGRTNAQLAGFFNYGEIISGTQMAGFCNVGGHVKGLQMAGFLNVADSLDGIPIGLINVVVKNGYRKFEFSVSESQYINFSYRMGVRKFYNIYSFSNPAGPGSRWLFGFGLGGELDMNEKVMMNLEAVVNQELWIAEPAVTRFLHIDRLNLLNQFRVLFAFNPSERVSLFVGPTFNVAVAESNPDIGYLSWQEIGPNWAFFNKTYNNVARTNVKMWIGIMGGVRL
ncbi:MAG: hypothetical protein AMS23_01895 [Bacteroides sp. SM1_62]|nr:MAG: hypothetical protein AMS23_01895 [Bacteroides sp. SM1_62]